MNRRTNGRDETIDEQARKLYHRALSGWAMDLLNDQQSIAWQGPDPEADYRNRDWSQLYTGSVLDD